MKTKNLLLPLIAFSLIGCSNNQSSSSVNDDSFNSSSTSQNIETSSNKSENNQTKPAKIYLVGDSTVCAFSDNYYYPRYGYGTQLYNYFNENLAIENLALSGRSSKSFITESNYTHLVDNIKEGDYVMIGFGHNDEKSDDAQRFTNPTGNIEDTTSFKHYLYNYYIKIAQEKNATPILCTPVVRANADNNYNGSSGHITTDGDYAQCIRDLGTSYNVTVVDLTTLTKNLYSEIGYNEAINYHAWTNSNSSSVDKTHLNIYGAKNTAYMFANAIKQSTNSLKDYVLNDIVAPSKEKDLIVNPQYQETTYTSFNKDTYVPSSRFSNFTSSDWYGTAFGDTGGSPISDSNGYVAEETSQGVFRVGQTGTASGKGKITSSSDGFAMVFKQIDKNKNFTISADLKVLTTLQVKQGGFGLMLRDDIYVNQESQDATIKSNYVAAGLLADSDTSMRALFSRENQTLVKENNIINGLYQVDDTAKVEIIRLGQAITTTIIYKDITYSKTYYDFDLLAIDNTYFYVGMFANRGTTVEATNVMFEITGDAIEA